MSEVEHFLAVIGAVTVFYGAFRLIMGLLSMAVSYARERRLRDALDHFPNVKFDGDR